MLLQAIKLARRELRGGLRGFRIFLACLTLGVAAIATVNSVASGVLVGLREDGREINGGDIALRQIFNPATQEQRDWLDARATVSDGTEMRAMARTLDEDQTSLIELKTVDDLYPLYGSLTLAGGGDLQEALAQRDGRWGAVVDDTIRARLGVAVGDTVRVGQGEFELRGIIEREPDRASGGTFNLGPRFMIANGALDGTDLVQPGSLVYYHHRLRLPEGTDVAATAEALGAAFPEAGWRVRSFDNAAPQLQQSIGQLALFLTLVGLTALLVGGVGVGNAVRAYLDGKIETIATLKCLGARSGLIFATYLTQTMVLGVIGTALGLIIGAFGPIAIGRLVEDLLPVRTEIGIYPGALALAAGFGLLTALTFSLWPLARARDIPAGSLFRDLVAPGRGLPKPAFIAATAACAVALGGLAVVTADEPAFAFWFVVGAAATIAAFRVAAWAVVHGSRRLGRPRHPGLRLALSNLHRPGAPTAGVVLSLGLGLTVLVSIALIQGNLSRTVQDTIPRDAPAYFFWDIQSAQIDEFHEIVEGINGAGDIEEVPYLRGRIVSVNGVPAAEALLDPSESWLIRGDRGVTYRNQPRASDTVIEGEWWPEDYEGPTLVSIYSDIASAFGIGLGDMLTVNVLGRDIDAEVANIRDIDWGTLSINFTLAFSSQPLAQAPHTFIATVKADDPDSEGPIQRAVTASFANVTAVRVRDALDTVNEILGRIVTAVQGTAGITLVAGTLVLAGAIAAGHRRRTYDSVVLKVLGATRGTVVRAFLLEYGLLGVITALIASVIGSVTAWVVLTQVMNVEWVFLPSAVIVTAVLCTAITLALGFVGTWRALGQKAAPLLRND